MGHVLQTSAESVDSDQICVYEYGYRADEVTSAVFTGVTADPSEVEVEVYTRD